MVKENKDGNRFALRMGSMVISGVLGLATLIGIFWGKSGLLATGITILVLLVLAVIIIGTTY